MTPYVCKGTLVTTHTGRAGLVLCVDRKAKVAVITSKRGSFTEYLNNLKVMSYREVE